MDCWTSVRLTRDGGVVRNVLLTDISIDPFTLDAGKLAQALTFNLNPGMVVDAPILVKRNNVLTCVCDSETVFALRLRKFKRILAVVIDGTLGVESGLKPLLTVGCCDGEVKTVSIDTIEHNGIESMVHPYALSTMLLVDNIEFNFKVPILTHVTSSTYKIVRGHELIFASRILKKTSIPCVILKLPGVVGLGSAELDVKKYEPDIMRMTPFGRF